VSQRRLYPVQGTAAQRERLTTPKTSDAVATFLDAGYVQRTVQAMEKNAGHPVTEPEEAVRSVSQRLRFTDAQQKDILNHFIRGGAFPFLLPEVPMLMALSRHCGRGLHPATATPPFSTTSTPCSPGPIPVTAAADQALLRSGLLAAVLILVEEMAACHDQPASWQATAFMLRSLLVLSY
jgi:hypothetical protein